MEPWRTDLIQYSKPIDVINIILIIIILKLTCNLLLINLILVWIKLQQNFKRFTWWLVSIYNKTFVFPVCPYFLNILKMKIFQNYGLSVRDGWLLLLIIEFSCWFQTVQDYFLGLLGTIFCPSVCRSDYKRQTCKNILKHFFSLPLIEIKV